MRKIVNISFITGLLLTIASLTTVFFAPNIWNYTPGITTIFLGIIVSLLSLLFWRSKDTPISHHFAWIGLGAGTLLLSIGSILKLLMADSESVFTWLILASYAFITFGYYFFMLRAGNIIDEVEKVKIVWVIGVSIILIFDLYLAIRATESSGRSITGIFLNLYYVSLDLLMVLIGITYLLAFSDGKIAVFYKLLLLAIILWAISDISCVDAKKVSFVLTSFKILSIFFLIFAQKVYAYVFTH